jgi:hypothetical protein
MILDFRFDRAGWDHLEARHALGVVASMLDAPFRLSAPDAPALPDAARIHVGAPEAAPADCAAIIPVSDWPVWSPASLELISTADGPLLAPAGSAVGSTDRQLPGPWLRAIAFQIQRDEERLETYRDEWDCFNAFSARAHELGVLDRPMVDECAAHLRARLQRWTESRGRPLAVIPRWKNGARFAVALTHDVDWVHRYSLPQSLRLLAQARRPDSYAFRHGVAATLDAIGHFGSPDPYSRFEQWMSEESAHGFRSTFFFCSSAPRPRHEYDPTYHASDRIVFEGHPCSVSELMRVMVARGFEVGLHGSYESYRSPDELRRQRLEIEEASANPVAGIRQHFLRFEVPSTWSAQESAGFRYDATLGFNEGIGFRAAISVPFHPWHPIDRRAHRVLELPQTLMDGTLFRTLKLNATLAARRVLAHLDIVERNGGMAVLLWHPNVTDTRQYPGWWDVYCETLSALAARDAWVAPAGEIAAWWLERQTRLAPVS